VYAGHITEAVVETEEFVRRGRRVLIFPEGVLLNVREQGLAAFVSIARLDR
jgi:1-acyl-sn-glycerol-3-phosphate acyltransferase